MGQKAASAPALRHAPSDRDGTDRTGPQARRESNRHTYGAIDLGTNNCRLLIARPADQGITVIDAFSRIVRLGEGLTQAGRLSDEAMDRAVAALGVCADKCAAAMSRVALGRHRGVPASRHGRLFVDRVAMKPGSSSTSSTPQEEARLAVLGCHKLLERGDGPALIFDIGRRLDRVVLVEQLEGIRGSALWSAPWGVCR